MRKRREDTSVVRGVSIVQDLSISRAVELDDGDVVAAWRTYGLHRCIHRLDCRWVAGGEVGVHRSGVSSENGNLHTEDRVAGKDVDKATSITVTHCEQARIVHAETGGDVGDKCIHEAKVVNIGVRATRSPSWV